MHIVLELKRRLTETENKTIFNKAGYDLDEELDCTDADCDYNFEQFVGMSENDCHEENVNFDDEVAEAHRVYFVLVGLGLPATDIYIDDGSAGGLRPQGEQKIKLNKKQCVEQLLLYSELCDDDLAERATGFKLASDFINDFLADDPE